MFRVCIVRDLEPERQESRPVTKVSLSKGTAELVHRNASNGVDKGQPKLCTQEVQNDLSVDYSCQSIISSPSRSLLTQKGRDTYVMAGMVYLNKVRMSSSHLALKFHRAV